LADEIASEVSHFCTFQTSVTLTLTLDQDIWHTVIHWPLPTNRFCSNWKKICGRTEGDWDRL